MQQFDKLTALSLSKGPGQSGRVKSYLTLPAAFFFQCAALFAMRVSNLPLMCITCFNRWGICASVRVLFEGWSLGAYLSGIGACEY